MPLFKTEHQAEREMEKAAKHVEKAFEHEARSAEKEFEGKGDTAIFGGKKHAKQTTNARTGVITGTTAGGTRVTANTTGPAAGTTTTTGPTTTGARV